MSNLTNMNNKYFYKDPANDPDHLFGSGTPIQGPLDAAALRLKQIAGSLSPETLIQPAGKCLELWYNLKSYLSKNQ